MVAKSDGASQPLFAIDTSLSKEAERRYLNYAISVITSRALPDVRDGMKPVQRRILYTMHNDLGLSADAKPKKSARVVGDVMGKYHPHGDQAIYDAMVRMAQDWVLRVPLIEGQGNFGSIDGDSPAAMRYTESKLRPIAEEILGELGRKTVDWRPNYDGTQSEPTVLPARFPQLLVNGASGIAVGMATSIPPHNLSEVIDASIALIADPTTPTRKLLTFIKGPDFPTYGHLLASKQELEELYESGSGSLKLRGEWVVEDDGKKGANIVIRSIPFAVERGSIVEKIAGVILSKKLPMLLDVRDESTDEVRIVLETKKGADPQLVMAYLFKNTPLAQSIQVNMTCLIPDPEDSNKDDPRMVPRRLGLRVMLQQFLDFRLHTLGRRLRFDLSELTRRIHILEGFETVFDALDAIIRLIRESDGRKDAAAKIMKRYGLSEEQTDAILELRLYRLAKLEILLVRKELGEKRAEAQRLEALLGSEKARWEMVKEELSSIKKSYGEKRRTKVIGAISEPEFQVEDFITDETATVVLSAQGWVKRAREVKDLSATRLREGDAVLAVTVGSTRASAAFFSSLGGAYVVRIHDVPASAGYGDPVQKLWKLQDGERMIALVGMDGRLLSVPEPSGDEPEEPFCVAVTRAGFGIRFSLRGHRDPSTRAGRRFIRLHEGDEVVAVAVIQNESDAILCLTTDGRALSVNVGELPLLSGAGKGLAVLRLDGNEKLIAATHLLRGRGEVIVHTDKDREVTVDGHRMRGARGADGTSFLKRGERPIRVAQALPLIPSLKEQEDN